MSTAPTEALRALARLLGAGLAETVAEGGARQALEGALRERFHARSWQEAEIRDAYGRSADATHVAFAGLLPEGSNPSGPYGGLSLVWFPGAGGRSLLTFVVGTLGLHPDEALLGRPGHRRHVAAMRAHLRRAGVAAWTKADPASIDAPVPEAVRSAFPGWDDVFRRYGSFVAACAEVGPEDPPRAAATVLAFLDLYAYERRWQVLAAHREEAGAYLAGLDAEVFRSPSPAEITALLLERRFVVLQGPPGTGKTRAADGIRQGETFGGRGLAVQFHPAVTYEDFVVGLAPEPAAEGLRFRVRAGWLLQAVEAAERTPDQPHLLQIDEINRGDLAKVLGEAIYLFEPREIGGAAGREVVLPHPWRGRAGLRFPANLYVLATMNTADRSIAGMDLAVRRRFAFVTLQPDRAPVLAQGLPLATEVFERLTRVFVEHVADDAFPLLPGQAYYLAGGEPELRRRLRYELLPLLDEYLAGGLLGGAAGELQAQRDWIADRVAG